MRTAFFIALIVLASTGGDICITRTMKFIGEVHHFSPHAILKVLGRAFAVAWMWLGITLMAISFFSLLAVLSWENVSFVIPATALSYAVGALGAKFLLGERVNSVRWAGVLLVCLGVALVWVG